MKVNILFVCSGDTCRSPMAAALFKKKVKDAGLDRELKCKSAGIYAVDGETISENAVKALKSYGINYSKHTATKFNPKMLVNNRLVLTMEQRHAEKIKSVIKQALNVYPLGEYVTGEDIIDPYGGSEEVYMEVLKYLDYILDKLLEKVIKEFKLK